MYKLKISVDKVDGECHLNLCKGDYFFVDGGKIIIPDGKYVCMMALQGMMPVFLVMQRENLDENDWASKSGQVFVCSDPKGKVYFKIEKYR